jgi:acyl-CoA thioester hydrolase
MRYRFFSENGFPPEMFVQLGLGPVYTDIHARFLREVLIGETLTITCSLSGLSPQGARWKVHHDFIKSNGKKAVILDLTARKPVTPTPHLLQTFNLLPRSPDFEILPETHRPK